MMIECDGWAGADCTDKVAGNTIVLITHCLFKCQCLTALFLCPHVYQYFF